MHIARCEVSSIASLTPVAKERRATIAKLRSVISTDLEDAAVVRRSARAGVERPGGTWCERAGLSAGRCVPRDADRASKRLVAASELRRTTREQRARFVPVSTRLE
jgi:hypothetical protein